MVLPDHVFVHIRMIIMIKSDNYWYEVICYIHKKILYYHIYLSNYDVRVQMLLPKRVLVNIQDDKYNLISLSYVSTLHAS